MKKQTKIGRPLAGKEPKKSYNVYLEPKEKEEIIEAYGSLTNSVKLTRRKIKR